MHADQFSRSTPDCPDFQGCHLRVSRPLPAEALPRGRITRLLRGEPQTARVNRAKSQATVLLDSGCLPDRPVDDALLTQPCQGHWVLLFGRLHEANVAPLARPQNSPT